MDPVLHLVRNAVSHGIEPPAERRGRRQAGGGHAHAVGAATAGEIGHARDRRRRPGHRRGGGQARARAAWASPVPDGPLDARALLDLICAPGFSTRDEADRASGRGVGMAVVQPPSRSWAGRWRCDTRPGRGTRFVIELPLTLAITDAIIAHVGDQTFAVPQAAVREVIEVEPRRCARSRTTRSCRIAAASLPIVRLAGCSGSPSGRGGALHVFVVGTGLDARRPRRRSHRRAARNRRPGDRRSADSGRGRFRRDRSRRRPASC